MKTILFLTLTALLGLGSVGLIDEATTETTPRSSGACEVVCGEKLPADCPIAAECKTGERCVVRCEGEDGRICELTLECRDGQCVVVACEPVGVEDCGPACGSCG